MWEPTNETFEKQTAAAKIYVNDMIEMLTLDGFISFFIVAYKFINRTTLERKEVLGMIDNSPKSIYTTLEIARKELGDQLIKENKENENNW